MTVASIEIGSSAQAPLEKIPLETYVPPAKPSLIGLSRTEIADRLGEIGVAPAQRKMRTQQLWHDEDHPLHAGSPGCSDHWYTHEWLS
jgi:23S rRNA (adenine2503-C2)-methyltransferase